MNKLTIILINTVVILFTACSPESKSTPAREANERTSELPTSKVELNLMPSCSIYNSRNWNASLIKSEEKATYSLTVTGEVDLPTPGYVVDWSRGMMDRMQPPGQKISLITKAPKGMSLQVITSQEVKISMETPISEFRHVSIYCGEKLLVSIPDIKLAD